VLALKLAQVGLADTEKVRVLPLGSVVVGVKLYGEPAVTDAGGVPLMVGGGLLAAFTVIEKAGSEALLVPSLTEITMLEVVPTLAACGVPESCPVLVLKLAQAGGLATEKVRVLPLGSVVEGVKLYAEPAVTDVAGVPLIVGGGTGSETGVFVKPA
jgi:hypothetical protein